MTAVLIYVDTSKKVGDPDHLKVFANADAAEVWFAENDPGGVVFNYDVIEPPVRNAGPLFDLAKLLLQLDSHRFCDLTELFILNETKEIPILQYFRSELYAPIVQRVPPA